MVEDIVKTLRMLILATLLTLTLGSCSNAAEKKEINPTGTRKGAQQMKTYYMGRFAIDVPADFKLAVQSHRFQYAEITEVDWPVDISREVARTQMWDARIAEIKKLRCPKTIDKVIMKNNDIRDIGQWCKGVLFYGNYMSSKDGHWEVLIDVGPIGLWVKLVGLIEYEQEMLSDIKKITAAYTFKGSKVHLQKAYGFYLKEGVINLPYSEQEETYARFEGPMGMILRLEMGETHKVEEAGVMDRLAASLAINFAPGVEMNKIRTRKRTVARLAGQEIVIRLSDRKGKELFFAWDYQGKEDSGQHPEIKIGIECPDGNLGEKLELWDKLLNSFRAAL